MTRQRGFALLVVLWTLPLLTMIGAQLTAAGRFESRLAGNLRGAARAEAVADGAIRVAMFRLGAGSWAADGLPRQVRIGDGSAIVRVLDHAGRIDPNDSDAALITALLRQVGVAAGPAAGLARAMAEWRMDSPDLPAIAARYRKAGLDYGPTGKPFRSVGEIGLVLGMTPDILAALAPHLSVFKDMDPDPRLADPVVIAALRASGQPSDAGHIGDPATRPLIADVEAVATIPGGGAFTRRVVIRIAAVDRAHPKPWRILTWESATD